MSIDVAPMIGGVPLGPGSRDRIRLINPANEDEIGSVVAVTADDVDRALTLASRSLRSWSARPAVERGEILLRAAHLLSERMETNAATLTREQGKTLAESRTEWERAIETLTWHGGEAERLNARTVLRTSQGDRQVAPEPIGVVAAFAPWNYPAVIIARKVAAALVAGCPVVLKGAEETPGTAVAIAETLFEAGLPGDVLQVLFGRPADISAAALRSPHVRALTFTGSTPVGKRLAELAAPNLVRLVLELGGHSPVIVCEDADIDDAARVIAAYKYDCTGQSCNAPSRVYAHDSVRERFLEAFLTISKSLKVGDGMDAATHMGPLNNERRVEAIEKLAVDAATRGGRFALGSGRRVGRPGFFVEPTVMVDVPDEASVFQEEPFGPILPISTFQSVDEVIERANANQFGLASYVFASDPKVAAKIADRLQAGSIGVNQMKGVPPDAAVGGIKDSGYGYEGGAAGVAAFQNLKLISGHV